MKNQTQIIKILHKQLQELITLRNELGYDSDFNLDLAGVLGNNEKESMGKQEFLRWADDTFEIIKININLTEGKRLKDCLKNKELKIQMIDCCSYLKILIKKIQNAPEKYSNILKKHQNNDFALKLLNNMHEEVVQIAKDKIQYKDYKNIILDVCIALENHIKKKINKPNMDIGGAKLMEHIFSKNKPIIRLYNNDEEQKGFMFLFSGVVKAIRNRYAHNLRNNINLQEALEILGFLSFLFRTIDKGKVKNKT